MEGDLGCAPDGEHEDEGDGDADGDFVGLAAQGHDGDAAKGGAEAQKDPTVPVRHASGHKGEEDAIKSMTMMTPGQPQKLM